MTDQHIDIRPITEEEWPEWARAGTRAFGGRFDPADESQIRGIIEIDRSLGAFHNGRIVGTTTAHTLELTILSRHVPFALVDAVSVQPTHRRRGLLNRMMKLQLEEFQERGEFLAGLTATESSIYGRFGFGIASWGENWTISRDHTEILNVPQQTGETRFVDPEEMRSIWPQIFERVRHERNGMFSFPDPFWDLFQHDPEQWRGGASGFFHVVYETDGGPTGCVSYRLQSGVVIVNMLLGENLEAERALWSFCFGIDLMTEIRALARPVDDPLPWLLINTRKLERSVRDELWLRLVDVPAAIEARSYDSEARVVIEVRDQFCPWNQGRYEMDVSPDGALCKQTTRSPDISLDVSELGAAYLGGVTLETMRRSGRVDETTSGAVAMLDRALAVDRQPWIIDM
ncbi:MAG: GNAT family N-acetyltransferase [SAR202 cluster bacterium]|nr:GNAT family N-acetyltransferase [SAR202 cluster bacterium]MDP6513748.1 GNAT family N-acetyltransferase [SAR202 cluster bacterium]